MQEYGGMQHNTEYSAKKSVDKRPVNYMGNSIFQLKKNNSNTKL